MAPPVLPVNSRAYWDARFSSGDWELKGGRLQTRMFADAIASRLEVAPRFAGTLVDFGCGLGDGLAVYRARFPRARLIGVDFSASAVAECRRLHGTVAEFLTGDHRAVPAADVIVASNVLEHLPDDEQVLEHLLARARDVFVAVPYRERIGVGSEHVNAYDESSFGARAIHCRRVFLCRGFSQYGWELLWDVHLKNVARVLVGKTPVSRSRQILFHFESSR